MKRYLVLSAATFGVGLAVISAMRSTRIRLGLAEQVSDTTRLHALVAPGHIVRVRNVNGTISVEPTGGDQAEVLYVKRWRHAEPESVSVRLLEGTDGVTVCVVTPGTTCDADGRYQIGRSPGDVRVRLILRIPEGARLDLSNRSGGLRVEGAYREVTAAGTSGDVEVVGVAGPVKVTTTHGDIEVETASGPVSAETTNGEVRVVMRALNFPGDVLLKSANGDLEVLLPTTLDAVLDAGTVRGRVETDYPVTMTGQINPRSVNARVGRGGRRIELQTINGDVRIASVEQ